MADITRQDIRIILAFALHVAKVDHDLATSEKAVLKHYLETGQISKDEMVDLARKEHSLSGDLLLLSGPDAGELLLKTLCAVAHSDGVMKESETEFIQRVAQQLNSTLTLLPQDRWGEYENEVLNSLRSLG